MDRPINWLLAYRVYADTNKFATSILGAVLAEQFNKNVICFFAV
jgi:hypothetical protein